MSINKESSETVNITAQNIGIAVNNGKVQQNNRFISKEDNLVESFLEIQKLWEKFVEQTGLSDENQFAQKLAKDAQHDPNFRKKLANWGQSIADLGAGEIAKVTGSEIAKKAVPKALSILALLF